MRTLARMVAIAALVQVHASCGADVDDPSAVTDIRVHDLRDAARGAPALPGSMDALLQLLPPEQREELRVDGYGSPIQYSAQGNRYELRSPGEDRMLNTGDDYVLVDSLPAR